MLPMSDEELVARAAQVKPFGPSPGDRIYRKLFLTSGTHAYQVSDFDFLRSGDTIETVLKPLHKQISFCVHE